MQYRQFYKIDGRHPWREVSPDAYVDYPVRTRHGGKVFYFNFELAKEMGLIGKSHPHRLNATLAKAVLDTFSLVIINEYDVEHGLQFPPGDIRPHKYMATRYLQCQHPSKKGLTSGDGRSIWNGYLKNRSGMWDISSCGTGATCLSPATAIFEQYYQTGDESNSYACGQADLGDGMCAALMSEIFHKNGIATERTLAIIAFEDGTAIIVRAHRNLLRPAHLFRLLKQNRLTELKAAMDYHIARQVANGEWPRPAKGRNGYRYFLKRVTEDFARAAALFESEYIFCWLDWDGDNVLMNSAVLDYGSVRQFGLYHHEYRYDDVERMSTTITEQKNKAKYIVQTFVQIVDYIVTGEKKGIRRFAKHRALQSFDDIFETTKDAVLIRKLGYDHKQAELILERAPLRGEVRRLRTILHMFERAQSKTGIYRIDDGITADAIFCVRDILRDLPVHYLHSDADMSARQFIEVMKSEYAAERDMQLTSARRAKIRDFQRLYRHLYTSVAAYSGQPPRAVLKTMRDRTALINRYDRVTGDAVLYVGERLVKGAKTMDSHALHDMFRHFVEQQVLQPEHFRKHPSSRRALRNPRARHILRAMLRDVRNLRSGL
ncbi:MAG: protein adenylyltransferase SelO family protein [Gammaproteobacteria bacterium]